MKSSQMLALQEDVSVRRHEAKEKGIGDDSHRPTDGALALIVEDGLRHVLRKCDVDLVAGRSAIAAHRARLAVCEHTLMYENP